MSTVGVSELANCMPSISFLPPEAESPEAGSNTPILTVFSPEPVSPAASLVSPELLEPQAARDSVMAMARTNARIFFIASFPPDPLGSLFQGPQCNNGILRDFAPVFKNHNSQKETPFFCPFQGLSSLVTGHLSFSGGQSRKSILILWIFVRH